jgi:uncharacterized protein YceH (UPF0502 family)
MLRGAQTPGELKTRTERLHSFGDMSELGETLDRLIERDLVGRLDRRPGQREERYRHLLSEEIDAAQPVPDVGPVSEEPMVSEEDERIRRIESQLDELRSEIRALREELGA